MTESIKYFVRGATLMFAGPMPPRKRRYRYADDQAAIASDWAMVGKDIQSALNGFAREHHVKEHAAAR